MSGKIHHLNPLQARKQLLVIESDLNRAQLARECEGLAGDVRDLIHRVKSAGYFGATAVSLIAGLSSLRSQKAAAGAEKPSWWSVILKAITLLSAVWPASTSEPEAQKPADPAGAKG